MWLRFSTVTALCIYLVDVIDANPVEDALDRKFRDRSQSDWEDIWHDERHNRCREDLTRHMFWACEKDIYRLVRRNSNSMSIVLPGEIGEAERFETDLRFPWLRATQARTFFRWRRGGRRKRRSITAECCEPRGCTWEEYAEYCPFKRQLH